MTTDTAASAAPRLPSLRELRLRWTLYGPLPRCTTDHTDDDWGKHCWGLIWPWQRQDGHMHARCRAAEPETRA